jgi:hypothetical protein
MALDNEQSMKTLVVEVWKVLLIHRSSALEDVLITWNIQVNLLFLEILKLDHIIVFLFCTSCVRFCWSSNVLDCEGQALICSISSYKYSCLKLYPKAIGMAVLYFLLVYVCMDFCINYCKSHMEDETCMKLSITSSRRLDSLQLTKFDSPTLVHSGLHVGWCFDGHFAWRL